MGYELTSEQNVNGDCKKNEPHPRIVRASPHDQSTNDDLTDEDYGEEPRQSST